MSRVAHTINVNLRMSAEDEFVDYEEEAGDADAQEGGKEAGKK